MYPVISWCALFLEPFYLLFFWHLQPPWQQHLRRRILCAGWSIGKIQKPWGARVSPAIHVSLCKKCPWSLWSCVLMGIPYWTGVVCCQIWILPYLHELGCWWTKCTHYVCEIKPYDIHWTYSLRTTYELHHCYILWSHSYYSTCLVNRRVVCLHFEKAISYSLHVLTGVGIW